MRALCSWFAASFLVLAATAAHAEGDYPLTLAFFSEPALLGMQLSIKQGVAKGKVSEKRAQCMEALPKDSFDPVIKMLLSPHFTDKEWAASERFLSGPLGKKYARRSFLRTYETAGEPLPSPMPKFTEGESKAVARFAATKAGEQLIKSQFLQSSQAEAAFETRIKEFHARCPN